MVMCALTILTFTDFVSLMLHVKYMHYITVNANENGVV